MLYVSILVSFSYIMAVVFMLWPLADECECRVLSLIVGVVAAVFELMLRLLIVIFPVEHFTV